MRDNMKIKYPSELSKSLDRWFQNHKKFAITFTGITTSAAIMFGTALLFGGCGDKNDDQVLSPVITDTPDTDTPESPELSEATSTSEVVQEVVLPEYLLFDANDNESLIEMSAEFIAYSRVCGVDLSSAKDISKYMDLYLIANIEQIDPMDYARYNYNSKTTQSIIDNYQSCINTIASDLLTVTPDTMLDYKFIADKDSYNILMQYQELIAKYNVEEDKNAKKELAKEIEEFLYHNFVNEGERGEYTNATYEIMGRFVWITNSVLPNKLPVELRDILCEDINTCGEVTPVGEKQKSERAQAETAIRESLDDMLAVAREYRNQDLSNVSEIEKLTGYQVEKKIAERVAEFNIEFVENQTYDVFEEKSETTKPKKEAKKLENGKLIAEEDIKDLGLDPETVTQNQYEQAVKNDFEEKAKNDPGHTWTNADGEVTASGKDAEEINDAEREQGVWDAFNDGYNGNDFSPRMQTKSYLTGYTRDSYNQGVAARKELEANMNNGNSSHFESDPNGSSETVGETITQEDYVESQQDTNSGSYFEPLPGGSVESSNETVIEEGYVETVSYASQIAELKALRAMVDTMIMNPTVTFDMYGNAIFTCNGEEFELSGRSMKA